MPRPNKPRDMFAEEYLAARVALERERRGWTYDGLAKRMTDSGCPIDPSAIYKIEKGKPPRRIVVDELVGFSRVFGLPVEELLLDPRIAAEAELLELARQWRSLLARRIDTARDLDAQISEVSKRIADRLAALPGAEQILLDWFADHAAPGSHWPADFVEIIKEEAGD